MEFDKDYKISKHKLGQGIEKFHDLLSRGMVVNKINIDVISSQPVSFFTDKRKIWSAKKDFAGGGKFYYLLFLNFPIIKNIFVLIFSIIYFLVDQLQLFSFMESLLLCRFLGVRYVSTVTDISTLLNINKQEYLF